MLAKMGTWYSPGRSGKASWRKSCADAAGRSWPGRVVGIVCQAGGTAGAKAGG